MLITENIPSSQLFGDDFLAILRDFNEKHWVNMANTKGGVLQVFTFIGSHSLSPWKQNGKCTWMYIVVLLPYKTFGIRELILITTFELTFRWWLHNKRYYSSSRKPIEIKLNNGGNDKTRPYCHSHGWFVSKDIEVINRLFGERWKTRAMKNISYGLPDANRGVHAIVANHKEIVDS